jgi:hypothetical protein
MKIYGIFKDKQFIIGFPTRDKAVEYGNEVLGKENGWDYEIRELWGYDSPPSLDKTEKISPISYPFPTNPLSPYTSPWTCMDGPKATISSDGTNEWQETGDGV